MNMLQVLKDHLPSVPVEMKKQVAALYTLQSDTQTSDELMSRIAGLLVHNPKEWLYLHKGHPLRAKAELGLKDTISTLDEHAAILVHPHERWCLVAQGEILYPAIFKSNVMDTHLFKVVGGVGARWVFTIREAIVKILETQSYTDGETDTSLANLNPMNDQVAKLSGAGFKL